MVTHTFPALGFDPAPGDPVAVDAIAQDCTTCASQLAEDASLLTGLRAASWEGQGATAFAGDRKQLAGDLNTASERFGAAGRALADYVGHLRVAQRDALEAERQAAAALADVRRLGARVDDLDEQIDDAEDGVDTSSTETDRDDARRALGNARAAYDGAVAWGRRIQSGVDESGDAAGAKVRAASDAPYSEPNLLQQGLDWAGDKLGDLGDAVGDWIDEHADLLKTISGGLKIVSAVAGLLSFIPVLAPFTAPIALIAGGAALAIDAALVATGNGDWKMLVLDAGLMLLPGVGKALKPAISRAIPALRPGVSGARNAARPLAARALAADPVDVVSGEMVMRQVDLELDGLLRLELSRTHVSTYRVGHRFGGAWASTLDQRLEVDAAGACFASADGMLLRYPTPLVGGDPVLPVAGPRRPLARGEDGGYTITDPETGQSLHFGPAADAAIRGAAVATAPVLPLAAITDRNGSRVEFRYDDDANLVEVRHSGGYRVGVETTDGLVTALRLLGTGGASDGGDEGSDGSTAGGQVLVRYGYDGDRRLTEVIDAAGEPQRFDYDADGRMAGWQDRNGGWYRYTYDDAGRCVRTTGSGGALSATFDYRPEERVTVVADSLGQPTTYHHDERLEVVRTVDPLGGETTTAWDRFGKPLARTDPLGRTTTCAYDGAGNLVAVTRPDGSHVSATYDELGHPLVVTGPDGAVWRHTYDRRGNLLSITDPAGATTTQTYDGRGHVTAITDALGRTHRIETDAAGLPVRLTDPDGAIVSCARDGFGRVVAVTDPLGGVTRLAWTAAGSLAARTAPDGTTERWAYDGEGNLVEHVDQLGQRARFEYTHFDLVSARTDPDGSRYDFDYDTELRLVGVTNPQGLTWRYDYDAAGNLVREVDFDGRALRSAYDAAGQLVERVNAAGEVTRFAYDQLGRVVEQRADGAVTTFAYDPMGAVVRAVNADATLTFERDPMGRVLAERCNGRTVTSTYDPLGRRVHRRTPSGAESEWEYDAAGRPAAMHAAGHSLRFGYDAAGREVERRLGAGAVLTQTWDANSLLRTQTLTAMAGDPAGPERAGPARPLQHRAYRYRADGFLTGVDDLLSGRRTWSLDRGGRVVAVDGPGWSERYAYDRGGRLTGATWTARRDAAAELEVQGGRDYAGSALRRAGKVHFEHDAQGRVVLREVTRLSVGPDRWRYGWDADDRLVRLVDPRGTGWRYRYDPFGRRIAKERLASDGASVAERVTFTWDGPNLAEQVVQAEGADRVTVWEWEPGGFRPLSQTERVGARDADQDWIDERFYAIVTDLVGTPAELVTPDGEVASHRRATVWGSAPPTPAGAASCPLRFPGQYHDEESGLHYNFFRYYDPSTSRYQSGDPIGLRGGGDPHGYVPNPARWIDPAGLAPYRVTSNLKHDSRLIKEAETSAKSVQDSLNRLTNELVKGNHQPGIGTKPVFGDVLEARARDGARVYFRKSEGLVEILGKSDKSNQQRVINILRELYE